MHTLQWALNSQMITLNNEEWNDHLLYSCIQDTRGGGRDVIVTIHLSPLHKQVKNRREVISKKWQ